MSKKSKFQQTRIFVNVIIIFCISIYLLFYMVSLLWYWILGIFVLILFLIGINRYLFKLKEIIFIQNTKENIEKLRSKLKTKPFISVFIFLLISLIFMFIEDTSYIFRYTIFGVIITTTLLISVILTCFYVMIISYFLSNSIK